MKLLYRNRKGNILTENIIFIILNLVFLAILIVFLFSKMGGAAVLEEKYAKEIALAIDSARPGMLITINMEDAIKVAKKEGISAEDIVKINQNLVTVKLRDNGGYDYSFFNDFHFDNLNSGYYLNEEGTGFVFSTVK